MIISKKTLFIFVLLCPLCSMHAMKKVVNTSKEEKGKIEKKTMKRSKGSSDLKNLVKEEEKKEKEEK